MKRVDDQPIRILRIIARLNIGGPAIQAVSLSAALSGDSFRTELICGHVNPGEGDMSYLAQQKGVKPTVLPGLGREISPAEDVRAFHRLQKIIRDFKPHIIHTHTAKAGALGRMAGIALNAAKRARHRIRLVHTFHGHVFHGYFGTGKTFVFIQIERLLARFTNRIIVISPLQQADICDKYRIVSNQKVRIVPLGLDLGSFRDCFRHRKSGREKFLKTGSEDQFVIGIVGRLTFIKNHRMFLEAVKVLKDLGKCGPFRFIVVGDGELRAQLETCARELGVSELVHFVGWHKDMLLPYGAMDGVALTSMNEGTPVTLIEAMAAGIPVIAAGVGGVPDLLGKTERVTPCGFHLAERGIMVRPQDPVELAHAFLFLRENRKSVNEMSGRAKQHVFQLYSMERLVRDMKILYSDLLFGPSA